MECVKLWKCVSSKTNRSAQRTYSRRSVDGCEVDQQDPLGDAPVGVLPANCLVEDPLKHVVRLVVPIVTILLHQRLLLVEGRLEILYSTVDRSLGLADKRSDQSARPVLAGVEDKHAATYGFRERGNKLITYLSLMTALVNLMHRSRKPSSRPADAFSMAISKRTTPCTHKEADRRRLGCSRVRRYAVLQA